MRIDYEFLGDLVPAWIVWDESDPEAGSHLFHTYKEAIEFLNNSYS